jgi:hypothetical protein
VARKKDPNDLQIHRIGRSTECDGCGRIVAAGEPFLGGIESCCSGGCSRLLCFACVKRAAGLVLAYEQAVERADGQGLVIAND